MKDTVVPGLDLAVPDHLLESWTLTRKHFGNTISFYTPSIKVYDTEELHGCGACTFMPVSVTGGSCDLQCDHCRARVLKPMAWARTPERLWELAGQYDAQGAQGLLVSGGSDHRSVVPLMPYLPTFQRIKERYGMRVIVHVGMVDRTLARGLGAAGVDAALLDIIGDAETIRQVYHVDLTPDDFERTLASLAEAEVPMSPHVVMGLHYGEIRGEYEALRMISRYPVASLVLVGLLPLPDTPMAHVTPPSPEAMGHVFREARLTLPTTPILLGCERPYGGHKKATDRLAIMAGVNGIAYPAEGTVALVEGLGLRWTQSGACCAMGFAGG